PRFVDLANLLDDRMPLRVADAEHAVRQPLADGGPVGGNRLDSQLVDLFELARGAGRRAGHSGQPRIQLEIVLHRDARRLAALDADFDAFLRGLDGLVQAGAPFAALGRAAGELVDDHHFAVAHDILAIAEELALDLDRALDVLVDGEHPDL